MLFDVLGVKRSRVAVHNWYRRSTDSQLAVKVRIAFVDQKTIRINDEQYRLYSTVDPETNRIHHSRRFPSRRFRSHENTSPSSSRNTGVFDIVFLVDDTGDLIGVFDEKTSATASTNTASEIPLNMFSAR